jgi:hypothetical protein
VSVATVLQWLGAAGVLVAFALSQRGVWPTDSVRYLTMNLVGAVCLFWAAVLTGHGGFVVLEAAWALIALRGLWMRGRLISRS